MAPVEHTGVTSNSKMEEKQTDHLFEGCIYRLPPEIRKPNKRAYTPRLVSIGPLHIHSMDKRLQYHMDNIKEYYVRRLLDEVANELKSEDVKWLAKQLKDLKDAGAYPLAEGLRLICKDQMEKSTDKAKGYYAEEAVKDVNSEMLLKDGCFILELLRKTYTSTKDIGQSSSSSNKKKDLNSEMLLKDGSFILELVCVSEGDIDKSSSSSSKNKEENRPDPIIDFPMMRASVHHDLLLLENQLPFFALEDLFRFTLGRLPGHLALGDYLLNYFGQKPLKIGPHSAKIQVEEKVKDSPPVPVHQKHKYDHILHFLHNHYLTPPLPRPARDSDDDEESMPTAFDLEIAAVKFVGKTDNLTAKFVPQSGFRRARFEIPTLHIYDSTEAVLSNFIAFEKCRPGVQGYFTSYASLMDRLINTEADVKVLEKAKVIHNKLGRPTDFCRLFNNLCKEIPLEDSDFHFLRDCKAAAKYNKAPWSALHLALVFRQYVRRRWSYNPYGFKTFSIAVLAFLMQVAVFVIKMNNGYN